MKEHQLCLEPLSLREVGARELVDIAGHVGFDYVGMFLHPPLPALPADAIVADVTLRRETADAMKKSGVRLLNFECLNLTPEAQVDDFAAALACGHELGARTATAIVFENSDRSDVLAKYRRLCDMAGEMGIRVNVEFIATGKSMSTLEQAIALIRDSRRSNAGVIIDVLHLIRTGSSIEAMAAVDPDLIGRPRSLTAHCSAKSPNGSTKQSTIVRFPAQESFHSRPSWPRCRKPLSSASRCRSSRSPARSPPNNARAC